MTRKVLTLLLALALILSCFCAFGEEAEEAVHTPVAILYTNDVHCGISDNIGYAGLAAYKKAYEAAGCDVALIDNGDAVQGAPVGTLSKGDYIIDIMNEIGYDVAAFGNHEFDYSIETLTALMEKANFPYVSVNFCGPDGPVADPYVILEKGGWKIAFVGISTPETLVKSVPTYFQNEDGEYIYSFMEDTDGTALFTAATEAAAAAREEGADFVVAMCHLGIDAVSEPFTSSTFITSTTGFDAVLDGHSHSIIESETVLNKDGEEVLLSSTGTKLQYVGVLNIAEDGTLATSLHGESIFQDPDMTAFIDGIEAQYEDTLNTVIASSEVELYTHDPVATNEEGKPIRIVRAQETNLGDLCADGYRFVSGADIGVVNGGGVRAPISAGDVTFGQVLNVHPFGNAMCVAEVTGQQVLDALEWGAHALPGELGGFLQVSGVTFDIDCTIESPCTMDEQQNFTGVEGERRVRNVLVGGEPIDPEKTYTFASTNYMIKSGGDGYTMFKDCKLLQDEVMLDNQVLITYVTDVLGGVIGEAYADPYGEGRINIISAE